MITYYFDRDCFTNVSLPRDGFWDFQAPKIGSPTRQPYFDPDAAFTLIFAELDRWPHPDQDMSNGRLTRHKRGGGRKAHLHGRIPGTSYRL